MKNFSYNIKRISLLLVYSLFFLSCAINPVTGKKEFMLMSESQEKALGLSYDPQVVSQFGLYDDQQMQDFIKNRGEKMARISHRPGLDYQFRILDSPVVNAFAVPGGYVYFTRGIMAHFNNEAEFAGVLGHEIGHITARHSAKQYSNQMLAQLGLIVGMVVSEDFRQYSDLASTGLGLLFLKYGRNHESQSDKLGVEYSTRVGYDAHEMANFFQTIKRIQGQSGGGVPTLLSTHPDPGNRFTRVHELAKKEQTKAGKTNLNVNRDQYLRMIDGLVYGEDPKQGYVENNVFYHPEMKFQFPVPQGWQVVNTPAQVQMAPQDGKALIVLTLAGEKTLNEAANAAIQADNLQVISKQNGTVNGNNAVEITADLNAQVRLLMYLIQYNGNIYKFTGLAETPNFNNYQRYFTNTFDKFDRLTDQSKINRQPEHIQIVEVPRTNTLAATLNSFKMASSRHEELAILNGMQLQDEVKQGMLIKIVK